MRSFHAISPDNRPKRNGFSLVEAAVVLGVVGLVIGGIWVATTDVRRALKYKELTSDMALIISRLREKLSVQDMSNLGNGYNLTSFAITEQILPQSWITASGGVLMPLGTGYGFGIFSLVSQFDFSIYNIDSESCIRFVSYMTTHAKNSVASIWLSASGVSFSPSSFPVMPTNAQCISPTTLVIRYTR